ncbi:type Z 30S ribosomal protein S14 [Candidatus Gracilibacteria bacterium]|nr:type Z 30S ribosomal protein S14 [Candidatus Gracilibacteria bacterium]
MAKISRIVKCEKKQARALRRHKLGLKQIKGTQVYNICKLCGRSRGYMGDFKMCRICFRGLASQGRIAGVTKSSW